MEQQRRLVILAIIGFILFMMYRLWQEDHPAQVIPQVAPPTSAEVLQDDDSALLPQLQSSEQLAKQVVASHKPTIAHHQIDADNIIHVETDVLDLHISAIGGNVVYAGLRQYPEDLGNRQQPVILLNNQPGTRYVAQSTLVGTDGPATLTKEAHFTASQHHYALQDKQKQLIVNLKWQNPQGLIVTKQYTFSRGSYAIGVEYHIDNRTKNNWVGNFYTQLSRTNTPPAKKGAFSHTFFGASLSTADEAYKKITFSNMNKLSANHEPVLTNPVAKGGWVAMQQHYFLSAWIPSQSVQNHFYTQVTPSSVNTLYTIGTMGPQINVASGATASVGAKLYIGPEIGKQLSALSPTLDRTIDYGILWVLSAIIFWMMAHIFQLVDNWGWAIVIVTIIIKLCFYWLSAKSYRSMARMRDLQPKITSLKERFGEDREKFSRATMELYKKEKVSPVGGCLPMLIQIPFFIALYWVLVESVQLRQAPWILWIHDLSIRDPYFILPILMGITMFLQQRLSPPPADATQAKVMMFLPVIFTGLFLMFPAGLLLYWVVNNTFSMIQQWYIMKGINAQRLQRK